VASPPGHPEAGLPEPDGTTVAEIAALIERLATENHSYVELGIM
jgi:hypothetical protein